MIRFDRLMGQFSFILTGVLLTSYALALGNHPESSTCSMETPYYAVCNNSRHGLSGWTGECYVSKKEAQAQADEHAAKYHDGELRWVGVKNVR